MPNRSDDRNICCGDYTNKHFPAKPIAFIEVKWKTQARATKEEECFGQNLNTDASLNMFTCNYLHLFAFLTENVPNNLLVNICIAWKVILTFTFLSKSWFKGLFFEIWQWRYPFKNNKYLVGSVPLTQSVMGSTCYFLWNSKGLQSLSMVLFTSSNPPPLSGKERQRVSIPCTWDVQMPAWRPWNKESVFEPKSCWAQNYGRASLPQAHLSRQ